MKKLNFIAVTTILVLMPFFQSCLNDDGPSYSDLTIATLKATDTDSYYFGLDSGKKMHPGDDSAVRNYPIVDGKRVFVWFHQLEEQVPGYDYNIRVVQMDSILTKEIIPLTEATADSIGDNKINVTYHWIAQGYLTMEFQYYGTRNPKKKHMLNLVHNEATPLVDEEGYINLEFRHHAFDDNGGSLGEGLVSFKLDKVAEEMKTAKGLKVRVKTIYDSIQFIKMNFKSESRSGNHTPTAEQLNISAHTADMNY